MLKKVFHVHIVACPTEWVKGGAARPLVVGLRLTQPPWEALERWSRRRVAAHLPADAERPGCRAAALSGEVPGPRIQASRITATELFTLFEP